MKAGSYELKLENKISLRFAYYKNGVTRFGIISANKLIGFTTDNSGNPLPLGKLSLAWDNNRVNIYTLETLIYKINETASNDVAPLIQAIYRIHKNKRIKN